MSKEDDSDDGYTGQGNEEEESKDETQDPEADKEDASTADESSSEASEDGNGEVEAADSQEEDAESFVQVRSSDDEDAEEVDMVVEFEVEVDMKDERRRRSPLLSLTMAGHKSSHALGKKAYDNDDEDPGSLYLGHVYRGNNGRERWNNA